MHIVSVWLTRPLYTSRRYHFRQVKRSVVHVAITDKCNVQTYKFVITTVLSNSSSAAFSVNFQLYYIYIKKLTKLPTSVNTFYVCHPTSVNPFMGTGNYNATSKNMKLVHWPLMGRLLPLVQRGGDKAGAQPAQAPPCCTKCNSLPISSRCTNYRIAV